MKRFLSVVAVLGLALLLSQEAWAHGTARGSRPVFRPRAHVGVVIGPVFSPYWFPPPWGYPPPVIVTPPPPPPPPVYIEQSSPAPSEVVKSQAADYWYYCKSARAYYPSVDSCAEGWLPVLPRSDQ